MYHAFIDGENGLTFSIWNGYEITNGYILYSCSPVLFKEYPLELCFKTQNDSEFVFVIFWDGNYFSKHSM